jgi:hypothetical protein
MRAPPGLLTVAAAVCLLGGCGGKSAGNEPPAGSPDASTDGAASVADAGSLGDAALCANIVLSTYDESCHESTDCIIITAGEVCTGSCGCGGSVISISGQARYEQAISGIVFAACPCPSGGIPTCVQGTCTL